MTLPMIEESGAGWRLILGDCLEVMAGLPKQSVSLLAMDPPYNGTLGDDWDNQWATDDAFLAWMSSVMGMALPSLTDNSSAYIFASPRMSARVEACVSAHMSVIGSLVWDKSEGRKGAAGSGIDVTSLRTYWSPSTERVVFAEQRTPEARYAAADAAARSACGYWDACEAVKRSVFGDYLMAEFRRAGVTNRAVAALFPSRSGGLTGCVSNWLLGLNVPTVEQYARIREFLNASDGANYLRREYEDLRREYEDLRREYEDLRRPFFLTDVDQWSDVWRFAAPKDRQHPCQKPLPMMLQIVRASSRPGDTILDPFCGSATTGVAALRLGRKFIGIEKDPTYFALACERLRAEEQGSTLQASRAGQLPLLGTG